MAAPTPDDRIDPRIAGRKMLRNGFVSKVTLGLDPDVAFMEKTVKPPAYDGGDPIDQTTMFNSKFRTKAPQALIETGPITGTAAYDPLVLDQIKDYINVETTITVLFPDGSTLAIFGWLRLFDPDPLANGTHPEASFTFETSNMDSEDNWDEEDPVLTEVAGT